MKLVIKSINPFFDITALFLEQIGSETQSSLPHTHTDYKIGNKTAKRRGWQFVVFVVKARGASYTAEWGWKWRLEIKKRVFNFSHPQPFTSNEIFVSLLSYVYFSASWYIVRQANIGMATNVSLVSCQLVIVIPSTLFSSLFRKSADCAPFSPFGVARALSEVSSFFELRISSTEPPLHRWKTWWYKLWLSGASDLDDDAHTGLSWTNPIPYSLFRPNSRPEFSSFCL